MAEYEIGFCEALRSPIHGSLRNKLIGLAKGNLKSPLWVDTVLQFAAGSRATGWNCPANFLLLDLQRYFLYWRSSEQDPECESVVRYILDDYPIQPIDSLRKSVERDSITLLAPLDALDDLLPRLWVTQIPGVVTTCDFLTGEVAHVPARSHPESTSTLGNIYPRPQAEIEFRDYQTNSSLRSMTPPDLSDLVSSSLGPIRQSRLTNDFTSLPFSTTLVCWDYGRKREFCFGKGIRAHAVTSVSLCEAAERFQVAFYPPGAELVYGTLTELLDLAVDPRQLFFGRSPLCETDNLPQYSTDASLYWTWAWNFVQRAPALIPAQEVWFNTKKLPGEQLFINSTTSGCAVGCTKEEATLFALLEAIERDSFLTMWYLRRPCRKINTDSISYEPFHLLRRRWHLSFPQYTFRLYDLTTDVSIPTVGAVAIRESGTGPRTFHAAAAGLDVERACFSALKDLTGFRPEMSADKRNELVRLLEDPSLISGPADHFGLYALDESVRSLDFLIPDTVPEIDVSAIQQHSLIPLAETYTIASVIKAIANRMRSIEVGVLVKEISHPIFADRGLFCVKVITPGLYPLWFGGRARRVAVTDRLRRLALVFHGRTLREPEDLNLEPHPLS